ncbi:MAG: hypothetical protein CMM47_06570 [Rhodospirillaceae bacterium]|nr:hypothetical protein [Rhodospirillaceae bacterium]
MTDPRQAGFTILELLVGFTLLGLLVVVLAGGLRTSFEISERLTDRTFGLRDLAKAHRILRQQTETAFPLHDQDAQRPIVRFEGTETTIFSVGPAGPSAVGGLIDRELRIFPGGEMKIRTRRGKETVSVRLPKGARFEYFGSQQGNSKARWQSNWSGHKNLPDLVRLTAPGWPPAIAQIHHRQAIR